MTWKNTQGRIGLLLISFFVILLIVTYIVIKLFVSPQIIETETKNIQATVELQSNAIKEQMNRVKAQQRSITELVVGLQSEQIDELLPRLVNQYGDLNVFGGGIWPLPGSAIRLGINSVPSMPATGAAFAGQHRLEPTRVGKILGTALV
jgi:methyl-accepting chemotaxis protein